MSRSRILTALGVAALILVLHDLNLSPRYADHLVALETGRVIAEGTPAEVVTEDNVRAVFGLDSRVVTDPVSHTPMGVPIGRHHQEESTR